jgi:RNA-directed DNA polymerase
VRFRRITIPHPPLMAVQKWIASKVLAHGQVHEASVAFAPKNTLLDATQPHCEARWLIKIDIKSFFESVTERQAFRAFRSLGYQPLIAFEMTRLCTRVGSLEYRRHFPKWAVDTTRWSGIGAYSFPYLGHLPQGAPSSPMLANLSVVRLDEAIQEIANTYGLTYTRYADDLSFSSSDTTFSRRKAIAVIDLTYRALRAFEFDPNLTKTVVSPPGSRKVLLGLLVDGPAPKLSRDFKNTLRKHLYYLDKFGPSEHAARCKSGSIYGLKAHVEGLISHASQIDPDYALACYEEFNAIEWP